MSQIESSKMVYFGVANIFFEKIFGANNTYQHQILLYGLN